jgi:hypothetical protein
VRPFNSQDLRSIRPATGKHSDLFRIITDAVEELRTISGQDFLSGTLIQDVTLESGINKSLNHELGRVAKGVLKVSSTSFGDVIFISSNKKNIIVQSNSTMKVSLWVF